MSWLLFFAYALCTYRVLGVRWFDPLVTTDDSRQQLFPFFEALTPENFRGDLIFESMKGYLAPLHWWLGFFITKLTRDPTMTGHWIMAVQLFVTLVFAVLLVRKIAPLPVALFSAAWLLHTEQLLKQMAAGLPRGWWAPILLGYLYFLLSKKHRGVLTVIACGTLLNAPAAFLSAASYGVFMLYTFLQRETRSEGKLRLITLALLTPLFVVLAVFSVHRSERIGRMVSFEQASRMDAFQRNGGRFPFLPFASPFTEITRYGKEAFINGMSPPPKLVKEITVWSAFGVLLVMLLRGRARREELIPPELLTFLAAVFGCYTAARLFAFHLYVPSRYLETPLIVFFVTAFPVAAWRFFSARSSRKEITLRGLTSLCLLAGVLVSLSGFTVKGSLNLNIETNPGKPPYSWLRRHTVPTAVIAGHPSAMDRVPLLAARRAYITNETAHPFYDTYYREVVRRLQESAKLHYETDLNRFLMRAKKEQIDYFIFRPKDFLPRSLRRYRFPGLKPEKVRALTSRARGRKFLVETLPEKVDSARYPFMVYRDSQWVIINIAALEKFLAG